VTVALSATAVVPGDVLGVSPAPLAVVVGQVLRARAAAALTVIALAATANTVLLLLVSAARSIYGMAAAGVLPRRLVRLTTTQVPREAMIVVIVLAMTLISVGDLSAVARLTDAMVLVSFVCVNLAFVWLAVRDRASGTALSRARDAVVPGGGGAAMCAWLL
jgi:APA family basic amino acid/polyamine antiporter